ncbi:MAG TPA: FtsX-like permease family protein, partial [Vicinamibacterales bacterium]|nr:FtsX-like permease family protein [Vicinamibacterales bacterium]
LMSGRPSLVVGVMPPTFRLWFPPDAAVPEDLQAWVPSGPRPQAEPRGQQYLRVIGRVKPGVSMTAAVQQIAAVGQDIVRESPNSYSPGYTFFSVPMADDSVRAIRPALLSLLAAVSLLMVIACVNVAALLTVRAAARRQEAAVRIALGASRSRLLRQFLAEGLLLAGLGGLAGVVMARVGLAGLLALAPQTLSRVALARVDGFVLLLALAVAAVWGVLFSLAPMVEVLSPRLADAIGSGSRAASSLLGQRVRRTLVVAQVAFGVVLLVGATLLARGFERVLRIDTGFSSDQILTFRIAPSAQRLQGPAGVNTFHRELADELRALPGVSSVGAISHLPYDNLPNWGTPYLPEGVTDERQAGLADARNVAPGFFETVGARLIAGRTFTEDDTFQHPELVIVVDDVFARRIFPGQDPIGRIVKIDANLSGNPVAPARIIGIVGHLRHRALTEPGREQIFVSSRQIFRNPVAYVIRASGDLAALTTPIREAVKARDAMLPVYDIRPLDTYLESARAASRFTMTVAAVFAGVALVLAAVGVYGVVAYAAGLRRREFGIRLALGARARQIAWLVVGEGGRLTVAGLLLGLLGATASSRLLESQLYEIGPLDPLSYAIAAVVLACAALVACGLPATRAASTAPMVVLKDE